MTRDTGVQVRDDRRLRLPSVPLYLGFIGTGVGVALPGASLPAMLLRWRMTDAQGGRLFLFAWIGSSVGALIVQGSLRRTLFTGCAAIAAGALGLGFGSGAAVQAEAWMLLYGAGLGLAMTSISLIQQASSGERSGPELIRLNLLWALGAFVCPTLAEHALAVGDLRPLLVGLALTFVGLGLWCAVVRAPEEIRTETKTLRGWTALARVPLPLIVMTMLITGIEASAGGWLATYARRNGEGLGTVVAAPTCLWAGLLLSRLFWSVGPQSAGVGAVRTSAGLMAMAAAALVTWPAGASVAIAAFCLGFGIGPVYPLLLDSALRHARGGAIFFLAGLGSACLPWLTGVVSSAQNSLRTGLLVPVCASFLLLALALGSPLNLWASRTE
jgi:FHS family glucose/mannose:H+ symporter-like MFS transporter